MSKKNKGRSGGLVYSTDPGAMSGMDDEQEDIETLPNAQQRLKVKLDTKQRAGKVVTLVDGFEGSEDDLKDLGKELKTKCGTGGSVKDGQIIIQGDYKEKIIDWLHDRGYTLTKG